MQRVLDGQLGNLAAAGPGDVRDREDTVRRVPGRRPPAHGTANASGQFRVEAPRRGQLDEEHHPLVGPVLPADGERLGDFGQRFDGAVDLGGADPHAAGVEHRIGPSPDAKAAARGPLAVVAVAPRAGKALEIRRAVAAPVRIVPEAYRHRRKRQRANELALLTGGQGLAAVPEHCDAHAEPGSLQLAAVDRGYGIAQREAGHDVRPSGDRREEHVGLDGAVDVVEALVRKGRSRRQDRAQRGQAVAARRLQARLLDGRVVLRAGAEHRDALGLGHVEQPSRRGMEGRSVVQHERGPGRESADQPVPHHPRAARVVEELVARPEVAMQRVLLAVLQQRPARAVHDALGRAGRAGGVQDVGGMVERQRLEAGLAGRREKVPVEDRAGNRSRARRLGQAWNHDHALDRIDAAGDLGHLREAAVPGSAVAVAVDGEQDLGPGLPEAVRGGLGPEIRRAGGPDRAQARRRQHCRDGFRHVRHEASDAISPADAGGRERARKRSGLATQRLVADGPPAAVLAPRHQRLPLARMLQQVLGEVQFRAREPARSRHAVEAVDGAVRLPAGLEADESPQNGPERAGALHGPAVQAGVVGRAGLVHEPPHAGRGGPFRRGPPDRGLHGRSPPATAARPPPRGALKRAGALPPSARTPRRRSPGTAAA